MLVLLANWVPNPTPDFGANPRPFVLVFLAGFVIGILGHLVRSRPMVAIGIGIVFLGTVLLPLGVFLSKSQ